MGARHDRVEQKKERRPGGTPRQKTWRCRLRTFPRGVAGDQRRALSTAQVIRDVCIDGPGHFLGHDQTLNRMESDYFYPQISDRYTPLEWAERGAPDLLEQARLKTRELLAAPAPTHIDPSLDAELRDRFPIKLPAPHATGKTE